MRLPFFTCPYCGGHELVMTETHLCFYKVKAIKGERVICNKRPYMVDTKSGLSSDFACRNCHEHIANDEEELLEFLEGNKE